MFDTITVTPGQVSLSSSAEVDAAEAQLGIRFPTGYREFITQLGQGFLGMFIRIYPPRRILNGFNNVFEWRKRRQNYSFWDEGRDVLTKAEVLRSVNIGDTMGGDDVIVHPDTPERVYVLPRNSSEIFVAGEGLPAAIEWICSSGTLIEPFAERDFEPCDIDI